MTVDHDMSNRLFRLVVRWLDPWRRQEAEVVVRLLATKPVRESLRLRTRRRATNHFEKPPPDTMHRTDKTSVTCRARQQRVIFKALTSYELDIMGLQG